MLQIDAPPVDTTSTNASMPDNTTTTNDLTTDGTIKLEATKADNLNHRQQSEASPDTLSTS